MTLATTPTEAMPTDAAPADAAPADSMFAARTAKRRAVAARALQEPAPWAPPMIGTLLPAGDVPGDQVLIGAPHLDVAAKLYPVLTARLADEIRASRTGRVVVAIAGGSGAGKTGVAAVLAHQLGLDGVGSYIVSGDNYVWRIPEHNDAERIGLFRLAGARGLAEAGLLTPEVRDTLRELQLAGTDAVTTKELPWLTTYVTAGSEALDNYLGTPREIDFSGLAASLTQFTDGADELWLRRTGRAPHEVWFEAVDVSGIDVLFVEWTHGLSKHLHGADVGVYLHADPADTLAGRLARGRDANVDSPFVSMVLGIEQDKLYRQARTADIVVRDGVVTVQEVAR